VSLGVAGARAPGDGVIEKGDERVVEAVDAQQPERFGVQAELRPFIDLFDRAKRPERRSRQIAPPSTLCAPHQPTTQPGDVVIRPRAINASGMILITSPLADRQIATTFIARRCRRRTPRRCGEREPPQLSHALVLVRTA
jgi:hypothetical protein